jgi:hypothetical protein
MVPKTHAAGQRQGAGGGDGSDGRQRGHAADAANHVPARRRGNSGIGDINFFSEPVCLRLLFKEQEWRPRKWIS